MKPSTTRFLVGLMAALAVVTIACPGEQPVPIDPVEVDPVVVVDTAQVDSLKTDLATLRDSLAALPPPVDLTGYVRCPKPAEGFTCEVYQYSGG